MNTIRKITGIAFLLFFGTSINCHAFQSDNKNASNERLDWKTIDELYTYDGALGLIFSEDEITYKLWAPVATQVSLNVFKNGQDEKAYQTIELEKGEKGVWSTVQPTQLKGEFYSYTLTNYGQKIEVLDPYAKSLAITTRASFSEPRGANGNPSELGPKLAFAQIDGYEKREDAIIWEIHVRDFTVDPDITTEAEF